MACVDGSSALLAGLFALGVPQVCMGCDCAWPWYPRGPSLWPQVSPTNATIPAYPKLLASGATALSGTDGHVAILLNGVGLYRCVPWRTPESKLFRVSYVRAWAELTINTILG